MDTAALDPSGVQELVLARFFSQPGLRVHVRELARQIGASASAVGRAASSFENKGILLSEQLGRHRVYQLANSPQARATREIFSKTRGVEAVLRAAIGGLAGVEGAYIVGSYAAGNDKPHSDIDLLVVGNVDRRTLERTLDSAQLKVGREINAALVPRAEFMEGDSGFMRTVRARPTIPLMEVGPSLR